MSLIINRAMGQPSFTGCPKGGDIVSARMRAFAFPFVVGTWLLVLGCSTQIPTMPSRPSYGLPRGSQVGPPAPGNARFDRPEFALAFDYPGR